jgi:hypothetical protein
MSPEEKAAIVNTAFETLERAATPAPAAEPERPTEAEIQEAIRLARERPRRPMREPEPEPEIRYSEPVMTRAAPAAPAPAAAEDDDATALLTVIDCMQEAVDTLANQVSIMRAELDALKADRSMQRVIDKLDAAVHATNSMVERIDRLHAREPRRGEVVDLPSTFGSALRKVN